MGTIGREGGKEGVGNGNCRTEGREGGNWKTERKNIRTGRRDE